jgi:GntR family transcriptional regulator
MTQWNETQPIFLQIRQQLIEMILNGSISDGEAMPSVRQIATDLSVNPLTVTKAYQSLVELDVIVKKRGLGMYKKDNARTKLLAHERNKFLSEDWPRIRAQIEALELDQNDLFSKGEDK